MSWCEITDLDMYTRYYINVTGMTVKGIGPPAVVEALTQKGVSGQPPSNLTAHNTSSTSILIAWELVPPNEKYETTYAYEVSITQAVQANGTKETKAILGACVNDTYMTLHQINLLKYTAYNITVTGVTVKGFGKTSDQITVFTDKDIPEGSPQNITPAATSPTSLTLAWKPLSNDIANGLILGYYILLLDQLRNETQNITVQSLDQANIENLFPYTEYDARIVPFNSKGQGNVSDVILVRTKEAAPSLPPTNLTGQAPSSTKLALDWKPVDELHINGILRAYVIVYFITYSPHATRHNISIPVPSARKRRAITDLSSPSYELSGLKKYTTYTIEVMAYTVDYGVPSHEINITTAQDVPSHSPINVTAFNTTSTSINVTWDPVPDDHMNGIIMGYRVFYKKAAEPMDDFSNLTVNSSVFDVEINDMEFFTKYEFQVLAFTMVGDGNISEPLFCMTDEDVPESAPVNLSSLPANTTALTINWLPVIEEDRNGIILGYWVALSNSTLSGEFIRNISVPGSEVLTIVLGGLEVWTNYSLQVCASTVKGNGPWSGIVRGITDEEAPRVSPTNITAFNTSSTSLHVTWQPISTLGLRGILRAYRVYYIEQQTYFTRSLKNVTVDSTTLEVELVDLYKFTNYTVYVVARTNKDGVSSENVSVSTDEDKPDKAPADLEVWTPHSTALHVSWNEVPNGYKNGIIRGYKLQYTEMNDNASLQTEDLQPWKRSLRITGLKKFTLYNITVLSYTSKGDGVTSSKVLMTDQDIPDTPPLNIKAESTWTTHTIPLRWTHIPTYLLNGILTGYRIRYQAIEMGECPYEENPREVILPPENTSTVLTGLESFAVYRIEVTGLTIKGVGPSEVIFAETCRCVKRLTTNWMLLDPYVTKDNSMKHGLGGLMPRFVNDMAVTCCQSCRTHGQSYVDFDFNGKDEPAIQPTEELHRLNINYNTDFSFPVHGYKLQDRFRHEFGYTGIIESPGTAYVINTKFGNQMDTSLLDSILACWPLALIGVLLAYISGFTIWAVDQVQNSEHFPRSFFPGLWEGFWWAYVSMTTVGYGDRTPLSNPGRLVAIVWTLAGVVIISILVGFIAVSLTTVSVGVDYKLYGAKVAAIYGSAQYNMGLRKNAKYDSSQIFRNFEEIYELLSSNSIGGVLIDGYMVGSKKELFEKPFLRIYKVYDHSSVYGVVTGGDSRKLGKCFHNYIQKNIAIIFEHVAENVESIQESPEPLEVERSTGLFDTDNELFKKNLMMLTVLLGCGILAGTVWEVLYRMRQKMKIQPKDSKSLILPSFEMREMLQDCKTQMYNLITEMKEKHRLQRRSILTALKSNRKYRYAEKETISSTSQRMNSEDDDLAQGLVAMPVLRKALTEREGGQEIRYRNLARVSFHVPDETDNNPTEVAEGFETWEGSSPLGDHRTTSHTPTQIVSQTSFA